MTNRSSAVQIMIHIVTECDLCCIDLYSIKINLIWQNLKLTEDLRYRAEQENDK